MTTESVQDRLRREGQEAFERKVAWEKAGRDRYTLDPAAATAARVRVVVEDEYPKRNRHLSVCRVAGPEADVQLVVGYILETDHCVQHYEHMLWALMQVTVENGVALALLTKNHYAGD